MIIPRSGRRTALAVVDVQTAFINATSRSTVLNITRLIESFPYDSYVEAVFSAERGSLWDRQTKWILPDGKDVRTISEVAELLRGGRVTRIHKHTKSIFNENGDGDVSRILRSDGIEEIHLVGFDVNDCVLASALDSFDRGFFTYVIEECCGASGGPGLKDHAVAILRHLNMTNNSQVEDIPVISVANAASRRVA
jgi:nicotinamidase-related amidase